MKYFLSVLAITTFLSTTNIARSENSALQAKKLDYIKGISDFIFDVISAKDSGKAEKIAKIRSMIEKQMDFEWNAKMALGANGKKMDKEDFSKFVRLYTELLCQNWANKLSIAEGAKRSDLVFSDKVIKINDTDDVVSFYMEMHNGNKVSIKIIVRTVDEAMGKFMIVDLVGEGVSVAMSYRTQFNAYIDEHGLKAIVPHLESIINKAKNS